MLSERKRHSGTQNLDTRCTNWPQLSIFPLAKSQDAGPHVRIRRNRTGLPRSEKEGRKRKRQPPLRGLFISKAQPQLSFEFTMLVTFPTDVSQRIRTVDIQSGSIWHRMVKDILCIDT